MEVVGFIEIAGISFLSLYLAMNGSVRRKAGQLV
jgi:hypothetical protein